MSKKQLLMMRKKGLQSPFFGNYANLTANLAKSAGGFIDGDRSLVATKGWTGLANCQYPPGPTKVTVRFSKIVNFTEITIPNGVTITNTTTAEVATITSVSGSGTITVEYLVTWITDPVEGDVVDWDYDGLGDYEDDDAEPLVAQTLSLINCARPPLINGPADETAEELATATFTVSSSNTDSYQWETDQGTGTWINVGTDSTNYTTPTLSLSEDGWLYRVTGTNIYDSTTTSSATLTVGYAVPVALGTFDIPDNTEGDTFNTPTSQLFTTGGTVTAYAFTGTEPTGAVINTSSGLITGTSVEGTWSGYAVNGSNPDYQAGATTNTDSITVAASGAAVLNISNMGVEVDAAGGNITNARSSIATVVDYLGTVIEVLSNEIRYSGARRVDHADTTIYNAGVDGIEYLDTESDDTTLISPEPKMLHEQANTNRLLNSRDMTQGTWTKRGITTVTADGSQTKPDGIFGAMKVENVQNKSTGDLYEFTNDVWSVDEDVAVSFYIKRISTSGILDIKNPQGTADGHWSVDMSGLPDAWVLIDSDSALITVINSFAANATSDSGIQFRTDELTSINFYLDYVQQEDGIYSTSSIDSTSSAATRAVDDISIPLSIGTNFVQSTGIVLFRYFPEYDSDTSSNSLFSIFDGLGLLSDSATINTLTSTDGTNTINIANSFTNGDELLLALIWNNGETGFSINVSTDGGTVWGTWVDGTYDGAFTTGTTINLFYNNGFTNKLKSAQIYDSLISGTIAGTKTWVESNAGDETS